MGIVGINRDRSHSCSLVGLCFFSFFFLVLFVCLFVCWLVFVYSKVSKGLEGKGDVKRGFGFGGKVFERICWPIGERTFVDFFGSELCFASFWI